MSLVLAEELADPVARASTPPCVEAMRNTFFSSINFDDEENPWVPLGLHTTA